MPAKHGLGWCGLHRATILVNLVAGLPCAVRTKVSASPKESREAGLKLRSRCCSLLSHTLLQEQQDGRDMIPAGVGGPGKLFRAHSEHSLAGGEKNHGDRQTAGIASAKRKEMIHWCTHSKMHISRSVRCAACAGEEQR